ncbi:MAG: MOSC domain-containing protein [Bacteroidetes bacterium]|nr:MOSC domain-containing protein [Bacteroidota bacterium]
MNNTVRFKVISVNISDKKGTVKNPVNSIHINQDGVEKDVHAGNWHRQVSLLGTESIEKFSARSGKKIRYGEFAENITTQGLELFNTLVGDRFIIGDVELEVTQIGKECHGNTCEIFKEAGNCIMPKEGIFCKVIKGGNIKAGDSIEYFPDYFRIHVITLSDRAYRGEYEDKSGPEIMALAEKYFKNLNWKYSIRKTIIPDDAENLFVLMDKLLKEKSDIVFTTGGTGIGPRDITVDTVRKLGLKEIPGIMEMIRVKYGQNNPNALLSRSVAGVIGDTLIYTLPGSVKAVKEYMPEIFKTMEHLIYMLKGIDKHSQAANKIIND